jgi:hypothetical protein
MIVVANIDALDVLRTLKNGERKISYGTQVAINGTIKAIQTFEQQRVQSEFTVRKSAFILRQAAVIRGASGGTGFVSIKKGSYEARIQVGQKDRLLLSDFERGAERLPFTPGAKSVAVPITGSAARPTAMQNVPSSMFISALGFKKRGRALVGSRDTYIVPQFGIYQRIGSTSRKIYSFVQHPKRIDTRLGFVMTAFKTAEIEMPRRLRFVVADAFEWARTHGG